MRAMDDAALPVGGDVWLSLVRTPERCELVRVVDVTLDGVEVHDPLLGSRTVMPLLYATEAP